MKKILSFALAATMLLATAACGSDTKPSESKAPSESQTGQTETGTETEGSKDASVSGDGLTIEGEIENGKFLETKKITVEVYDRGNDGGSHPEDNFFTDYIKEGVLRDHNIEVTFVPVPRWTEVEQLNNLLAANNAPDICLTYDYSTIKTYAQMGGVTNLKDDIENYKDALPNLWGWLGENNIYWDKDPETGDLWAIEGKLANNTRINTFVRQDWLDTLGMEVPNSTEEFEKMLVAFRDNADKLLGDEADKMIPFSISFDIGWRADHILASFVDPEISTRERFIKGFDDRRFLYPGVEEGVELLNKWYNDNLIWKDFALYGAGDTTEDNLMKAGYVGAFMHNWDYPYRNADDSINNNLKRLVGEDAGYVSIDPFKNSKGEPMKFLPGPVDRKIFFPATNDEVLASLLYLDWITKFENREFLQIGVPDINHKVHEDGAIENIPATGDHIMNSPLNIDYTMTINGLDLGDEDLTTRSIAFSYPGVKAEVIADAYENSTRGGIIGQNINVGDITSETGMGPALSEKRDVVLNQAVVAKPEDFKQVFDAGMQDYLASGGQAIMDERAEKWEAMYGDATELPEQ